MDVESVTPEETHEETPVSVVLTVKPELLHTEKLQDVKVLNNLSNDPEQ